MSNNKLQEPIRQDVKSIVQSCSKHCYPNNNIEVSADEVAQKVTEYILESTH